MLQACSSVALMTALTYTRAIVVSCGGMRVLRVFVPGGLILRSSFPGRLPAERFVAAHVFRDGLLNRQTFHAACTIEAIAVLTVFQNIRDIFGQGNGPPVCNHDDVLANASGRLAPLVDQANGFFQAFR